MKRNLRIANAAIWVAAWIGAMLWTDSVGKWGPMFLEALAPLMLGAFIHIALRTETPEA